MQTGDLSVSVLGNTWVFQWSQPDGEADNRKLFVEELIRQFCVSV